MSDAPTVAAGQAPTATASTSTTNTPNPSAAPPTAGQGPTTASVVPVTQTTTAPGAAPTFVDGQEPFADEEPFDRERAMKTIRTLREEAKKAMSAIKELDQLRKERQEAADARLSDIDRASKRAAQLEAELKREREERQNRTNRYEVQLHAAKLGIVDPEAAVKLLDWSTLEYADDGQPKDVDKALKLLLKDRPYLAGQAPAGAQATSPTNSATRTQAPGQRLYSRADLADYQFYTTHRDDIQAAMREGRIVD